MVHDNNIWLRENSKDNPGDITRLTLLGSKGTMILSLQLINMKKVIMCISIMRTGGASESNTKLSLNIDI
jgi:hypothetical protein